MKIWLSRVFSFLFLIEGLVIAGDMFSRKTPDGGIFGSDFSLLVLVIFSGSTFIVLLSAIFLLDKNFRLWFENEIYKILDQDRWLVTVLIACILFSYETFQDILFLLAKMERIHYLSYRELLGDYFLVLLVFFLFSIQWVLGLYLLRNKQIKSIIRQNTINNTGKIILVSIVILLLFNLLPFGGFPVQKEELGFNELNAPVLGIQVILVLVGLVIIGFGYNFISKRWKRLRILNNKYLIACLFFLLAFLLWNSVPTTQKSFTDIPRPPNFEYYPVADSLNYEISAQRLLAGQGLGEDDHIGFRLLLAALHMIGGDGYEDIFPYYIFLISFTPAILYLLGKKLHSQFSGGLAAGLYILRFWNSLYLAKHITVPNPKEIMTEPLVALGLIILALLFTELIDRPVNNSFWLILIGGILGLLILFRVELLIMIPAIMLGLFIVYYKNLKDWVWSSGLIGIGVLLMISPWMVSSFSSSGNINSILFGRGNLIKGTIQEIGSQTQDDISKNSPSKPNLFFSHITNDLKQSVYYLPNNHQPLLTAGNIPDLIFPGQITDLEGDSFAGKYLERYVRSLPYWWKEWNGGLVARSVLPVLGSIFLIGIGFTQVKENLQKLGAILVLMALAHFAIYAFVGKSGGRFIFIVDWISLLYYAVGVSASWSLFLTGKREEQDNKKQNQESTDLFLGNQTDGKNRKKIIVSGVVVLLIGLVLPFIPGWFPEKYPTEVLSSRIYELIETQKIDPEEFNLLGSDNQGLEIITGKVLFPRYYQAGDYVLYRKGRNPDFSFARVEFYLVGTYSGWAALPAQYPIDYLPHGSEVILVGAQEEDLWDDEIRIHGQYFRVEKLWILE